MASTSSTSFDEEDVQQVLEKVARENGFKEPQYEISPATKAGDNYVGRVLRVAVREKKSAEKDPLFLIVKTAPVTKARRIAFMTSHLFRNEGNMYQSVLPTLNTFLKEHNFPSSANYPNTPRCLAVKLVGDPELDELDTIILEDKTPDGFRMLDRTAGLDAETICSVLRLLARLHSASIAMRQLKPEQARRIEAQVRESVFSRENPYIDQMQPVVEKTALLTHGRYPEGTPEYAKLRKFLDNYIEDLIFLVKPNPTISCVVHGDCWSNNILFKYAKGEVLEDICLIDFQFSRTSSPVLDLVYLIFLSTTKKTRDEHYQAFLQCYHDEVSSNLEKFGLEPAKLFSWSTLQEQLKLYGRFGLTVAMFCIPALMADSSETPQDIDKTIGETMDISAVFNSVQSSKVEELKNRLCDIVADVIELGYI